MEIYKCDMSILLHSAHKAIPEHGCARYVCVCSRMHVELNIDWVTVSIVLIHYSTNLLIIRPTKQLIPGFIPCKPVNTSLMPMQDRMTLKLLDLAGCQQCLTLEHLQHQVHQIADLADKCSAVGSLAERYRQVMSCFRVESNGCNEATWAGGSSTPITVNISDSAYQVLSMHYDRHG
jgi:hypothetical protein